LNTLTVCALGPTPYAEGIRLQEGLVRARAAGESGDWLLYPDHPPVLTVGRGASGDNLRVPRELLAARGIAIHEVTRGGDITWHGPGQLVGYPIVGLDRCGRDLHVFLRHLEGALIETLAQWGIPAENVHGKTGVWTGGAKIASIGIAVRRWVSYHGFALNVSPDLGYFDLIHPCGLQGVRMTSMAALLGGRAPGLETVRERMAEVLARRLGYEGVVWAGREDVPNDQADPAAMRR